MNVLQAIAAFFAAHMTKLLGTASTVVAATLGAAAAKQIPDLVAVDSPTFQVLTLLNILLGGATIGVGFNNSGKLALAKTIDNALQATPKQGGFALPKLLLTLFLGCAAVVSIGTMAGCTHTQSALKAADTPSDFALVFLEGYHGALKSANALKDSGTLAGSNLERVRALELKAAPLVARIDPLRRAYEQTRSAADAEALTLAIDNAVREAAEFIKAVQQARGE